MSKEVLRVFLYKEDDFNPEIGKMHFLKIYRYNNLSDQGNKNIYEYKYYSEYYFSLNSFLAC